MRLILIFAAATLGFAADHPDLNGTWKTADGGQVLTIHQKADAVDIAETGKETDAIQCNTSGQACKVKGGEITAWYNGGTLVIMETHGSSRVIKKRLKLADDGKGLEEEIIRIVPAGSSEKVTLARQSGS